MEGRGSLAMSKGKDNPYVTVGSCNLLTKALDAKIEAQKLLIEAEIKAIKMSIYSAVTTLGIVLSVVEFALRFWRP
jgi:hypothetical protein